MVARPNRAGSAKYSTENSCFRCYINFVVIKTDCSTTDSHRHAIGRKSNRLINVKIVNSFYQPDAADLKKVVYVFTS
jgi:hypothetical protein